jgi:hypothetical protein
MDKWQRQLIVAAATALLLGVAARVGAETCTLELKRIDSPTADGFVAYPSPADYMIRATSSQSFFMQMTDLRGVEVRNPEAQAFAEIVKKEPAQYAAAYPFRGVAKLGSEQYAFVLDAEAPKPDADKEASDQKASDEKPSEEKADEPRPEPSKPEVQAYTRLYFDLNHNGDLTDDKVIEAVGPSLRGGMPATYFQSMFPRVDLSIDAGGTKLDYSFTFSVYGRATPTYSYASASLSAAAYREGEITLDGKPRHLFLVDFNSNGRFDDDFKMREDIVTPDGQLYPEYGDMLLVDPDSEASGFSSPYDPTTSAGRHYMSKLVNLDGRFYDLKVTPAGDKLTLTPSSAPLGHVTSPNDGLRAALYSDRGFVEISGNGSEPIALPEGEWRLLAYTIDQTARKEPPAEKEQQEGEKKPEKAETKSVLEALAGALLGGAESTAQSGLALSPPRRTLVSARATRDCPAVKVRAGETVALPFGPPYKPVVKAGGRSSDGTLSLALSIIGSSGEVCSNLMVNGNRPAAPEFTITTTDGKEVDVGKFKYG